MNEKLIEKYRYINVEHWDWWEFVYDDFIKDCETEGIYVDYMGVTQGKSTHPKIEFQLSYSQGDGAAFAGALFPSANTLKFLDKHAPNQYPMIRKMIEERGSVVAEWNTTHRGNLGNIVLNVDTFESVLGADHPLAEVWDAELDKEVEGFEELVKEIVEDRCYKLYQNLRDEYEHLVSDEVVWESILANELDVEESEHE